MNYISANAEDALTNQLNLMLIFKASFLSDAYCTCSIGIS